MIVCIGSPMYTFAALSCIANQIEFHAQFSSAICRLFRAFEDTSVLKVIQSADDVLLQTTQSLVNWIFVHAVAALAICLTR